MQKLIEMTARFCDGYLDEDYRQLCAKLNSYEGCPVSGTSHFYLVALPLGSAIIHALGSINFLFDRSFEPYVSANNIYNYFGTSKSTVSQKAKSSVTCSK